MKASIKSTTILEVKYDKKLIQLLINIKCIVIVLKPGFSCQNTTHYMGFDLCENNVRDSKYNT